MLLKKNIPLKFIVEKVWLEAIILVGFSTFIYVLGRMGFPRPTVPMTLVTVLGTAISLLLAFRTNQSYDRWWEARSVWGAIVNDSRSLVRQSLAFTSGRAEAAALLRRIAYRQIAWCYCLERSLRGKPPLEGLEKYLPGNSLASLGGNDNKPNALLLEHSADIQQLKESGMIDGFAFIQLDATVTRLCDHMGKCERIKNTVFPSTYSLFLHSFIYMFVFTIPFGLGAHFGISEIPLASGIGVAFFLIEKTAMRMQDPFENRPTDTAMTTIATTIHRNILQMTGDTADIPAPHPADRFYAM